MYETMPWPGVPFPASGVTLGQWSSLATLAFSGLELDYNFYQKAEIDIERIDYDQTHMPRLKDRALNFMSISNKRLI